MSASAAIFTPPGASASNPHSMPLDAKLAVVVRRAAVKLPSEIGRQLLALIEPVSLAIMAGVVVVWAGAQFFGVSEIAPRPSKRRCAA